MPKKVLIVHNYYQIPGGEDVVVANEKKLLEDHGHEVILYTRDNKELNSMNAVRKVGLFFTTIYNRRTYKDICRIVKEEGVDVIHVHNTLNLISPAVFYAARKCKVPVFNTIHNFRMLCPKATLYRDDNICEDCIENGLKCALARRCYRDSLAQTFVCVLLMKIHRMMGIYRYVRFICLTDFNRDKLLEINKSGNIIIDPKNVYVKPNFMIKGNEHLVKVDERDDFLLFAGRLDESKGIDLLLDACKISKAKVIICGSGPLEGLVRERINSEDNAYKERVKYVGMLTHEEVMNKMRHAKALILPTRWYEGFPMSIAESFSVGTPVIGPNMGNVGNIITDGITGCLFESGKVDSLAQAMDKICDMDMHNAAYEEFVAKYTDEINYKELMEIYGEV